LRRKDIALKIALSFLIGILVSWGVDEFSYAVLKTDETRPPKVVQLDIPAGTAARVAQGQSDPSIPDNMLFVVGDTLQVNNHDSVVHQLGPLYIPAGSSAAMHLDTANDYSFVCSFRPSQYLGLTVSPPLDLSTRITGILEAGLPMGVLIALYTIFAGTPKKKTT
jgi:hypothetical protein